MSKKLSELEKTAFSSKLTTFDAISSLKIRSKTGKWLPTKKILLKILYITHYTELYGANRSLLALLGMMQKNRGIHVLVPANGSITEVLGNLQIPYSVANFHDEYYYKTGFSRFLGLKRHLQNRWHFKQVKSLVEHIAPDLIHSNSAGLHVGARLAKALSVPHIWHIREFGLQDYKAVHNLGEAHHLKWLNRASHLIAISKAIKTEALQNVRAPLSVVYNGVMPQAKMQGIPPKKTKGKVVFTLAGAFRQEKGQHKAVAAFIELSKKFPNAELHLPGDASNPYGQQVQKIAEAAGLAQRVYFPGFVEDLEALYQESDVLLMCSQNEAMGRVTAEAFAHRIPVIAYEGGANPELVSHKKDGLLYKSDAELIVAMQQLAKDADLRRQMGEAGHKKALTLFTEEHYVKSVEQVYKKVLKQEQ